MGCTIHKWEVLRTLLRPPHATFMKHIMFRSDQLLPFNYYHSAGESQLHGINSCPLTFARLLLKHSFTCPLGHICPLGQLPQGWWELCFYLIIGEQRSTTTIQLLLYLPFKYYSLTHSLLTRPPTHSLTDDCVSKCPQRQNVHCVKMSTATKCPQGASKCPQGASKCPNYVPNISVRLYFLKGL